MRIPRKKLTSLLQILIAILILAVCFRLVVRFHAENHPKKPAKDAQTRPDDKTISVLRGGNDAAIPLPLASQEWVRTASYLT